MARGSGNWLIATLLALVIVFLIANGLIAYRSAQTLANYERQVTYTHQVLGDLQSVLVTLDDAETSQRGYSLLDDPSYLTPYYNALNQLPTRLASVREHIDDSPEQQAYMVKLSALSATKLDELRQTVEAQQAGQRDTALALIRSGQGKQVMDDIRTTLAEMSTIEERLLDQRTAEAVAARVATERTLIVATLGEVILLGGVIGILWRNIQQGARIAAERAQSLKREQEARAQAEAAVRSRDDFLGIASHELKNPLTALSGNAQLLQRRLGRRSDLEAGERRMLSLLGVQTSRIQRLIDTMLDISRIEAGHLTIVRTSLDLATLVQGVVEEAQVPYAPGRITFERPEGPIVIEADALRLEQVVLNLLQNALRYSADDTTVTVRVTQDATRARIVVSDQGDGIPAEALPHLFERYYRATKSAGHRGGMGVGLFVVREIIVLHGGDIAVESTPGQGSTFTVALDRAPQHREVPDSPRVIPPETAASARIAQPTRDEG